MQGSGKKKARGNQSVCLFIPDVVVPDDPEAGAYAADFVEACERRAADKLSDLKSFTVVVVLTEGKPSQSTVAFVESLRGVDVRVVEGHSLGMLRFLKGWCVTVPKCASTIFLPGEDECTLKVELR